MTQRKLLPGKFVWFELQTPDPARAQAFYAEVLGWKVQRFPAGPAEYEMIYAGDTMIGGYAPARTPARWISYASVDDVGATVTAAVASGGKVVEAPSEIPGVGQRARIADPQGAELSLLRSASGDAPDGEAPQGGWVWNELHTSDPRGALAFYERVLGYTHESMDMGPAGQYHVINRDGVGRGGITGHLPPGVPPHWLPYVHVKDPDAAIERARKLGATVPMPPTDIPDIGRIAAFTDPAGASLAVMNPLPRMKKP